MHDRPFSGVDLHDPRVIASIGRYWRRNLAVMVVLLLVWGTVGLGCGVLFADRLNEVRLGGFRLGFWFAQQGSIVTFVILILVYALIMNRLDARHHEELGRIQRGEPGSSPFSQGTEHP